ncbi:hypothetical protein F4801DRAFT_323327 [Xylaria longipes]|nr:hypothetical protein F4801DRAFT_323327 [Xylaria longipes]
MIIYSPKVGSVQYYSTSLETERPTETHMPGTSVISLRKKLNAGSLEFVTHFWNVGTREEYALFIVRNLIRH